MKSPSYWKDNYVLETDVDEIEENIKLTSFASGGKSFELIYFEKDITAPNILISPGSGGHSYVFAELGYLMHLKGYDVFIMPKHGGYTINELMQRHSDALKLVPIRSWTGPSYVKDLYNRLPPIKKKLVEVDGSVYWMLSHPKEAAKVICEWFDETLNTLLKTS